MDESESSGISKDDKSKRREAALKAWKTIRSGKRRAAAKTSKHLEDFISIKKISSIKHPESQKPTAKRYGGGLVCQFEKTPPNIACGRFWELRWAFGCPLNCAYCYLRGTTRGNMKPRPVKLEYVLAALEEVFNDPNFNEGKPALFNSGELCDSLMFPGIMDKIADKFDGQNKHKLVTLTKFGVGNAKFLIEKPRKNVICAWSINATEVAKRWETLAPLPEERIKAAKMVSEAGYEVWVRIDPIFPVKGWRKGYGDIVYSLLSNLEPGRIILGTPRGLWKTIHYAEKAGLDISWARYFSDAETGWGKKLSFTLRKGIYEFMYDKLTALGYNKTRISICKETRELLDALGVKYAPLTCQCYSY
nr:radical SAM protein [Candidatus Freyarchaeota archaeon]